MLENEVINIKNEIKRIKEKVFLEPIKERLFYDGEYFDAYEFVSSIIKKATKKVILIDPYCDLKALSFFKNINKDVEILICNSTKSKLNDKDVSVFKSQYGNIFTKKRDDIHDRFLIIDDNECYSLGTSLNYMGKRMFAINKIENKEIIKTLISIINQ